MRIIEEWFSDIDSRKDPEKPIDLSDELSQVCPTCRSTLYRRNELITLANTIGYISDWVRAAWDVEGL